MKQKEKQSRRLLFRLFLLICIAVGLLIALYPFYVDSLNSLMDQNEWNKYKNEPQPKMKRNEENGGAKPTIN